MEDKEIQDLFTRYQQGDCSEEEQILLDRWYFQYNEQIGNPSEENIEAAKLRMWQRLPQPVRVKKINWTLRILAMTAAIVILLGVGTVIFFNDTPPLPKDYANDVEPGKNEATLTLANGKTINLSEAKNGALASDGGVEIIKTADGQLLYQFNPDAVKLTSSDQRDSISSLVSGSAPSKGLAGLNSITTPRGGQYHIALPDGTNVWINAGSTLRFPSSFQGLAERRVVLIGEAYFEVAQVKTVFGMQKRARKMPFIVKTDKQEVTVLGTHFNINSYIDEPDTKTTLLEGVVSISAPLLQEGGTVLKPGDQGVNNGSEIKVKKVDTDESVAWKNGDFSFNNENLECIMRKVARWYDVDVIYQDERLKNKTFGGSTSRYSNISDVLCMLELTGEIRFKVKGKKVTVME